MKSGSIRALLCLSLMAGGALVTPSGFGSETLPSQAGVSLSDGTIEILFAGEKEGFACTGIVNRVAGDVRFVRPTDLVDSFWSVKFTDRSGAKIVSVDNVSPAVTRKMVRTETGINFIWKGLDIADEKGVLDVAASVTLDPNEKGVSTWRLKTRSRSVRWSHHDTRFPSFRSVTEEGRADVMMPAMSLGAKLVRHYEAAKTGESFSYPGWFPMAGAWFVDDAALFILAADGNQLAKSIIFRKNGGFQFSTEARDQGLVGKSCGDVDYPVVVSVYKGDWWTAAKRYRRWALRQKWAKKGPKRGRADYPKRIAEANLWHLIEGEATHVSNYVNKITSGDWAGFKTICEWTKWQYVPYDANYPDLLPARTGVKEVAEWALGRGLPMMPYTNGRVWAKSLASFAYAQDDATVNPDGSHFIERYAKREFVAMCPAAAAWRRILVTNTLDIVRETGAGAIYLDQISCAGPRLCHNPKHGHPLGGGSWWADGYRAILEPLHAELSARNIPITSEGAGDAWLDLIDGYMLANEADEADIPFYAAVYSDYATYFCTPFQTMGIDFDTFFRHFSRRVLWGVQPGMTCWLTYNRYADYGKVLRAAARLREKNLDFLAYGELVGERRFPEATEVYAAEWRAADGRHLLVFANGAAVDKTIRVEGRDQIIPAHGFSSLIFVHPGVASAVSVTAR